MPDQSKPTAVRRYLVVIQAADGYPASGEPRAAPPDGPAQPMVHTAVLEADYEAAIADAARLRAALVGVSNAYGCFAGCTGALPGAPEDGSGHMVACRDARAALLPGAALCGPHA